MNAFETGIELERLRLYLRGQAKMHGEYAQQAKTDPATRSYQLAQQQTHVCIAMKVEHLIRKMSKEAT
jgi:hypothetical protein